MLSFKDNFFFIKFSILFFIITIFGFWGIDLNSEELYIAFSFFFLTILAFFLIRTSVVYFFTKIVNKKYSKLLFDMARFKLTLDIHHKNLQRLISSLSLQNKLLKNVYHTFFAYTKHCKRIYGEFIRAKTIEMFVISTLGYFSFTRKIMRARKSFTFSKNISKFFFKKI